MPGRLPRLTRRGEFLKVAGRGRKAARPGVLVQALSQPEGGLRLGFTATKKIGNAVARNRAKRRLREAARLMLGAAPPPGNWDLVLVARDATGRREWSKLLGDLRGALRQAGVPERVAGMVGEPMQPSGPEGPPVIGPPPGEPPP
ncbi:ribonuclease P protein component [Roseicella aquatilis]|uniref:Ribonuclease P protein component n=1 Tax=Roseicella aquatilis TaxID=2527868 RepID=A0A4R4DHN9_9PROT|nr:ribonuclease P protein component [Roseicella aquatilis]TCZ59882.1 ribonuclease P protein component [Roseicella aquatilis]